MCRVSGRSRRGWEILKYGAPARGPDVKFYTNHVLCYDQAKKIPLWVAEHLSRDTISGATSSNSLLLIPWRPRREGVLTVMVRLQCMTCPICRRTLQMFARFLSKLYLCFNSVPNCYSCFHELCAPCFSSLVESIFAQITSNFHKTCFKEGPKLSEKIIPTLKYLTEMDKFQDFKWGFFAAESNWNPLLSPIFPYQIH